MEAVQYISYALWTELITKIRENGAGCREFDQIKHAYPQTAGEAYIPMIYNDLGKLEEYLLTNSFRRFEKMIGRCLEEADIEIAEAAIRNLKRNLSDCLFFNWIPEYPEDVKRKMTEEVKKNVESFRQEYLKYIKRLEYSDSSDFIQDLAYMCKKKISV